MFLQSQVPPLSSTTVLLSSLPPWSQASPPLRSFSLYLEKKEGSRYVQNSENIKARGPSVSCQSDPGKVKAVAKASYHADPGKKNAAVSPVEENIHMADYL